MVRVGSIAAIRGDGSFLGAVGAMASSRRWLAYRIGEIFLPDNEQLTETIEAYLRREGK